MSCCRARSERSRRRSRSSSRIRTRPLYDARMGVRHLALGAALAQAACADLVGLEPWEPGASSGTPASSSGGGDGGGDGGGGGSSTGGGGSSACAPWAHTYGGTGSSVIRDLAVHPP